MNTWITPLFLTALAYSSAIAIVGVAAALWVLRALVIWIFGETGQ